MSFLRTFKHLLPRARAWKITEDKQLREFFEGLTGIGSDTKEFVDNIYLDLSPNTTREMTLWEQQFGLRATGLTEQERRDRIDANWKLPGGQNPQYIQDTLRANGFDVYVHEWWDQGTEPAVGVKQCVAPRNPLQWIRRKYTGVVLLIECGELAAQCGEPAAQAGNSLEPLGYPLVNKIFETMPDEINLCGEPLAAAGEPSAQCGNFLVYREEAREYTVPNDPAKWPYFLYIGAETFGEIAQVDPKRKDEFEELCLKICPTHLWLGILVEYV